MRESVLHEAVRVVVEVVEVSAIDLEADSGSSLSVRCDMPDRILQHFRDSVSLDGLVLVVEFAVASPLVGHLTRLCPVEKAASIA